MRADETATPAHAAGEDGPAFGSLANLGGPKKFKKKPVLVLDPEELEKAHMMFQDASAELLGEEVQRPERPSAVLGLAPMDDEDSSPEDMGADEEGDETDDTEVPTAEDLLRMSASRPEPDPDDEAAIAAHLEGLDFDHRIFPSLPLKSDEEIAAEEEAELARSEREKAEEFENGDADDFTPPHDAAYRAEATYNEPGMASTGGDAPPVDPRAQRFPVNPLPEPEAEYDLPEEAFAEPEIESQTEEPAERAQVFGDEPFLEFPTGPISWRPVAGEPAADLEPAAEQDLNEAQPDTDASVEDDTFAALPEVEAEAEFEPDAWSEPMEEPASSELPLDYATVPEAVPEDRSSAEPEDDTSADYEPYSPYTDEDPNRFEWEMEEVVEDGHVPPPPQDRPEPADDFLEEEIDEEDDSYTETDDEPVDGYAFMYSANPRGRTLHALAEGESNSLRARLIREREQAQAESEYASGPSLWAKFTSWLRGLLS